MYEPVAVTNHALVRWFREAVGMDVESHRRLVADLTAAARKAGASRLELPDMDLAFHFHGNAVVDITHAKSRQVGIRRSGDPAVRKAERMQYDHDHANRERRKNGQTHLRGKRL